MAGDWIKMRVWLRRDPRVASMAEFLATDRKFMDHITDPAQRTCSTSVHEYITSDITRAVTVVSLLEVWGVARERGDRDGDDLLLKHCDLSNLDQICSTPGFGEAMEYVEWAIQEWSTDHKGRDISSVRFPNFFKENESPEDRYKKQHAEAQARYRDKNKAKSDITSDESNDITVTPREEKRREDKYIPPPPAGPPAVAEVLLAKDLIAEGVEPTIARDWLKVRKAKKAPLTTTAWEGVKREAKQAGVSTAEAIKTATENNWASFKADWLTNKGSGRQPPGVDVFAGAL